MTRKRAKPQQPGRSANGTIDAVIRLYAHQRGLTQVEAARELLRGLASWFGSDFSREAERAEVQDE
jgi:hypothetical protein